VGGAVPAEIYDSTDSAHAIEITTDLLETVRKKITGE
jgi:hypothetical protein